MHTETLPLEKNDKRFKVQHQMHTIFLAISSKETTTPTILLAPKIDSYLEKRVWELIPDNGVDRTFQILLNEGKHVSFNEIFSIAAKKFDENILFKPKNIQDS